jgi:hypothetical protein
MVAYSNMTLMQTYHRVMDLIQAYRTVENIDWYSLVNDMNRAIKETIMTTLPYKQWMNVSSINIAHLQVLPRNFIRPIRLITSANGGPPFIEARYVKPAEYFNLTDWQSSNPWNRCSLVNPLYTLFGQEFQATLPNGTPTALTMYIAPNQTHYQSPVITNNTPQVASMSGILDCYLMPPDIRLSTDTLPIPYECENMVIMLTAIRVLSKIGDIQPLQSIYQKVLSERKVILAAFKEQIRTEKRELDSFVEPITPLVEAPPQPGEYQMKLV